MSDIVIFGGGKIGQACVRFLDAMPHDFLYYDQIIPTRNVFLVERPESWAESEIVSAIWASKLVIAAVPWFATLPIVKQAIWANKPSINFSESTEVRKQLTQLVAVRRDAPGIVTPPVLCGVGLAPGMIEILTRHACEEFETIESVKMMVGANPKYAVGKPFYSRTWSAEGVAHEYVIGCTQLRSGVRTVIPALKNNETVFVTGQEMEAFNTSGGEGGLIDYAEGDPRFKTANVFYKTLRYPGHIEEIEISHLDKIHHVSRNNSKRVEDLMVDVIKDIPVGTDDVVTILIEVIGVKYVSDEREVKHVCKILKPDLSSGGKTLIGSLTALQRSTVGGAFAVFEWVCQHPQAAAASIVDLSLIDHSIYDTMGWKLGYDYVKEQ